MNFNISIGVKNANGWHIGCNDIYVYPQNNPYRSSYAEDIEEADFEVVNEDEKSGKSADYPEVSPGLPFTPQLPEELKGKKAKRILMKLYEKKILDENFQPLNLSGCQKAYLAYQIAYKLGINNVWKVFSEFWHMKASVMRARYNEAISTQSIAEFDKKIKECLQ